MALNSFVFAIKHCNMRQNSTTYVTYLCNIMYLVYPYYILLLMLFTVLKLL